MSLKKKCLLLVLAAPLLLLSSLYLFTQTSSFRDYLASAATDAIGSSVEFGDDIGISALFPNVSISISSARLKTNTDSSAGLQRARLQGLEVSLSPALLFSGGKSGNFDLHVERASIISKSGPSKAPESLEKTRDVDVNELRESVQALADLVDSLSDVRIKISIADFDYFQRDGDASQPNARYRIKDASLVSDGKTMTGAASLVWSDLSEQQIKLTLTELSLESPQTRHGVSGKLHFDLSPFVAGHYAAQGRASFGVNDAGFELQEFDAKSDWFWLRGDINGSWDTTDLKVKANIEIRSLELGALATQSTVNNAPAANTDKARLFPFDLFTASLPLNVGSEVTLDLGAVRLDTMPIANGLIYLALQDGVLSLNSDELSLLGGDSTLSLEIDNTLAQLVAIRMKLESDDMQLDRIRVGADADTVISRGTADTIIALKGEGPSPGHISSSLDGYVLASIANAEINQRYSTLIDRGLVSWALSKVSLLKANAEPSTTKLRDPLALDCASLRVYINDGRAEVSNGAIVEFPENNLFSSGYIDLASEEIGFAFRTRSKSLFDWSAISIIKYAELGGTLQQPKATFNTTELAKQGVKTASSAAWGPLPSLVYSLAEAGVKNSSSTECTPQVK